MNKTEQESLPPVMIMGYSVKAYAAVETMILMGRIVRSYADTEERKRNPYGLEFIGENQSVKDAGPFDCFISEGIIADREYFHKKIKSNSNLSLIRIIHSSAIVAPTAEIREGSFIGPHAVLQPMSFVGNAVICNARVIIGSEVSVDDFAIIGAGALLSEGVNIGRGVNIGTGAIIMPGITIGAYAAIAPGTLVTKDIKAEAHVLGNPQRLVSKNEYAKEVFANASFKAI